MLCEIKIQIWYVLPLESHDYHVTRSPGPLHLEDQIVIAISVKSLDCLLCIVTIVIVDKGKSLR